MKSCWIKTEHEKTTLEFREIPVPQPKPGEIVGTSGSAEKLEKLKSIGCSLSMNSPPPRTTWNPTPRLGRSWYGYGNRQRAGW